MGTGRQKALFEQRQWLMGNIPPVIGHRGAALHAPENTLAGVRKARELGAHWVEVDVRCSADGEVFLLHDDDLDRTTNGRGPACAMAMVDIAALDAGSWFDPAFSGEAPPTLLQLFEVLRELEMSVIFEIKASPGQDAMTTEKVIEAIHQYWPKTQFPPLISSFSPTALKAAMEADFDIPRALLVRSAAIDIERKLFEFNCATLHIDANMVDDQLLGRMDKLGVPILSFTVNDGARAKSLLQKGVISIISDEPQKVISALLEVDQ